MSVSGRPQTDDNNQASSVYGDIGGRFFSLSVLLFICTEHSILNRDYINNLTNNNRYICRVMYVCMRLVVVDYGSKGYHSGHPMSASH